MSDLPKRELERQTAGLAASAIALAVDIMQTFIGSDDEQAMAELQTAIHRWHRNQGFQEARARGAGPPIDRFDGKRRDHELEEAFELARNYVSKVMSDTAGSDPHADENAIPPLTPTETRLVLAYLRDLKEREKKERAASAPIPLDRERKRGVRKTKGKRG